MKKTIPSTDRKALKVKTEVVKKLRSKGTKPSLISTIRCT